ncbi:MAG: HD domain-containing protein [Candidatus Omnitrophica bacterium]|nr:HD domain-containing protein [Candidatus Omnitrophota bacterium]
MEPFNSWRVKYEKILKPILNFSISLPVPLYLVGGSIRDILLNQEKTNPDFDFCLPSGAINFAKRLSKILNAGFVVLDKQHGCARLVKRIDNKQFTFDFSDFRDKDILKDLAKRDFTINSMAINIEENFFNSPLKQILIDPYGGYNDLKKRIVRCINPFAFDDDPLRILRAFSFVALFNFSLEKNTLATMKQKKALLQKVSPERLRDELFKILNCNFSYRVIKMMHSYGILEILFPELKKLKLFEERYRKDRLLVFSHSIKTYQKLEELIARKKNNSCLTEYLQEELSGSHNRMQLLKLSALLHDVGKPFTFTVRKGKVRFYGHERKGAQIVYETGKRLRLSNEELRILTKLILLHLRPGYLVTNYPITPRAKFRFFRDAGPQLPLIILLALADERATSDYLLLEKIRKRYEYVLPKLMDDYFKKQKEMPVQKLVDGYDIMKELSIGPSKLVGVVLRKLEELRAIGKIKTKEEALRQAHLIKKKYEKSS